MSSLAHGKDFVCIGGKGAKWQKKKIREYLKLSPFKHYITKIFR